MACAVGLVAAAVGLAAQPALAQAPQASSGCQKAPPPYRRFVATIGVDGVQRTALVNVPPGQPAGKPLPLVLMFHGAGGNGRGTESSIGLSAVGNRYGVITAYPNANGKYWNLRGAGRQGEDDIVFTRSLIDLLEGGLCIVDARVYAAGGSNGAGFAARVGCELSDRVAAIATVAGVYGLQPPCQPQRPISVLEMHGTADQTVPYTGWGAGGQGSVSSFLTQWNQLDSCPQAPAAWRRLALRTLWKARTGCAGGTTVAHIKLLGEPHAWPSPGWVDRHGNPGVPFDASTAVVQFFLTQTVSPQSLARRR